MARPVESGSFCRAAALFPTLVVAQLRQKRFPKVWLDGEIVVKF